MEMEIETMAANAADDENISGAENATGTETTSETNTEAQTTAQATQDDDDAGQTAQDSNDNEITKTQAFAHRLRENIDPIKQELARAQQERELLESALKGYGYEGTPQEIADQMLASQQETTVEAIRAQREAQEIRAKELVKNDPEYLQAQEELASLRAIEAERIFAADMETVKKINPNEQAKTIKELGDDFAKLRAAGIKTEIAYNAIMASRPKATPPPEAGKVNSSDGGAQEYFTKEEVKAMDMETVVKNLDKIDKSQKTWK